MNQSRVLVVDWETTGIRDETKMTQMYVDGPQGIEIGAVVVEDWVEVGAFWSRVRFLGTHNGVSYGPPNLSSLAWAEKARNVHGIPIEDAIRAPHPRSVAEEFVGFLKKHFDLTKPIMFCAHNPMGDRYYTRQLIVLGGVEEKVVFHYRMYDSYTMGALVFGSKGSDDLFRATSGVVRGNHNALDDARFAAKAMHEGVQRLKKAGFGTTEAMRLPV
jgi:DNA polymerase III epsilon subunit-like protein